MKKIFSLAIVSHVIHYEYNSRIYAYGPYVREIEIWADLFPQVVIAAPYRVANPPSDCLPLDRSNISIAPQLERGGDTWQEKLIQILSLPVMIFKLSMVMRRVDAIQVRSPGNLGLLGAVLAPLFSHNRVAKYAGQWNGYAGETLSNRLQRNILSSRWWNSPVLVYGHWENQPFHVKSFFTSMMSKQQVKYAEQVAESKSGLHQPINLLYSGRLVPAKRVSTLIEAMAILKKRNVNCQLKIIGDGPIRMALENQVRIEGLIKEVQFEGAFPYGDALRWNEWADCLLLASKHSEGWPKVVAEAMCYGVIPIAVRHGQVGEMIAERGMILDEGSAKEFAESITKIAMFSQEEVLQLRKKAYRWASLFSLDSMREQLRVMLSEAWQVPLSINEQHEE